MAVRHVLNSVEIRVVSRNFNAATPAVTAVKVQRSGVRNPGAIDQELVVVETFVLWTRDADPGTVLAFGQGIFCTTQEFEDHCLCLWRNNAGANAPFRIDLGVLFSGLVKR